MSELRPEWLKEKYQSVEDQAKAYNDLEKRFGSFKGAPEGYQLPEGIDANDELVNILKVRGKEMNLSQDGFNQLLGDYSELNKGKQAKMQEVWDKLSPEQQKNSTEVKNFLANNFDADTAKKLESLIKTPEDLSIFDKLRRVNVDNIETKVLMNEGATAAQTDEEFKQSIDWNRCHKDRKYKDQIQAEFSKRFEGDANA